ncbi:MAG: hypothetical protein N3G19_02745 [Candidatus Pacearchaeota archaeon]|nr:hypothetical protein [Candidatus Pacearchaeota archaeon]
MSESTIAQENKQLVDLLDAIVLPYQVVQLNKTELSALEKKFYELSDENRAEVIRIAEEIFDSEMPREVKKGRWYYCLMYGVVEFLQEQQNQY